MSEVYKLGSVQDAKLAGSAACTSCPANSNSIHEHTHEPKIVVCNSFHWIKNFEYFPDLFVAEYFWEFQVEVSGDWDSLTMQAAKYPPVKPRNIENERIAKFRKPLSV